jgi:hypothetical protein
MTPDLMRIAAALSAYPWTAGTLTTIENAAPRYCALGLLLRYAGVPQEHLARADSAGNLWSLYGNLLRSEYGIPNEQTAISIMAANDTARSHADAIERVLGILTGNLDPAKIFRLDSTMLETDPSTGGDDAGSLALVP